MLFIGKSNELQYDRRVDIFEVPVNLTMRNVCRLTPQIIPWVGVCAAKDSGHDAVAAGAVG